MTTRAKAQRPAAQKPVQEDEGSDGLGNKTGGEGGPEREDAGSLSGGGAETGPTKDVESVPGGGDDLGPTPDAVPQDGGFDADPDAAARSTESGPNPAEDDDDGPTSV